MEQELNTPLTAAEARRLKELESMITKGFVEMATGMAEIRDRKLYRQHYKSFDEYTQRRWLRSRDWADALIKSAIVVQQLEEKLPTIGRQITNERTARALGCVPEELRQAVVERISTNNEPVNSGTVKRAAEALQPVPAKRVKIEDDMGTVIPTPIVEIWNRRGEIQALATEISRVKCHIENMRKDGDKLFMKIDQSVVSRLGQIHRVVANAIPYCVCGECEGRLELRDGICGVCKSTGFMSKEDYNHLIPEEKRKIRIKGIELRKSK